MYDHRSMCANIANKIYCIILAQNSISMAVAGAGAGARAAAGARPALRWAPAWSLRPGTAKMARYGSGPAEAAAAAAVDTVVEWWRPG